VRGYVVKKEVLKDLFRFSTYLKTHGYAPRTIESYMPYVREFMAYLDTKSIEKFQEVTPEVVSQYQMYLGTELPGKRRLSLKTQNLKMIAVMNLFRFLVRERSYLYDPTSHIQIKDPPRKRVREVLTEKDMVKILNAPNPEDPIGLRDKAMLELYYSCGIRNTESRTLLTTDIDLENRLVRIRNPKGGGDETVPMGKVAALYHEEYLRYSRPKLLKNDLEMTLFLTKSGKPLDDSMPSHIVQKYAKIAGLKRKADAHTIRHTCGTHLHNHGADIRFIQELLRHKSLDTTQVYVQVRAEHLKKVLSKTHPRERGVVSVPAIE
jgi:integrase/recombinase XerD